MMNDSESNRFPDPVLWLALLVLFGLLFYLFAYIPMIYLLDSIFSISAIDGVPEVVQASALPLEWLYENVSAYQAYLDFFSELID